MLLISILSKHTPQQYTFYNYLSIYFKNTYKNTKQLFVFLYYIILYYVYYFICLLSLLL